LRDHCDDVDRDYRTIRKTVPYMDPSGTLDGFTEAMAALTTPAIPHRRPSLSVGQACYDGRVDGWMPGAVVDHVTPVARAGRASRW
jgi:hypothetical protein